MKNKMWYRILMTMIFFIPSYVVGFLLGFTMGWMFCGTLFIIWSFPMLMVLLISNDEMKVSDAKEYFEMFWWVIHSPITQPFMVWVDYLRTGNYVWDRGQLE